MKKVLLVLLFLMAFPLQTDGKELSQEQIHKKRMDLYVKTEAASGVPWYYLAGIDQYERSIRYVRNDLAKPDGLLGILIPLNLWAGIGNPNLDDQHPVSIHFFAGFGNDGSGDGKADRTNEEDILYSMAHYISKYGIDDTRFRLALWDYYKRDKTVGAIMTNAKIYRKMNRINLDEKAFPIPKGYNYTYHHTWGDRRGWGGRRIHEGTDIFADYGTPVRSVSYGVIELKGWNKYGGWRVGIRDLNNTYHYYAHLSGFAENVNIGDIVKPGDVIGSVGSSGYGPPGTAGKFPPHLHYGMYKDNGKNEWSFDPYPHLKAWERMERKK